MKEYGFKEGRQLYVIQFDLNFVYQFCSLKPIINNTDVFQLFSLLFLIADSFWSLAPDCLYVLGSEFLVDWIKHAFITRFNPELSVDLYKTYTTNLAYDLAITKQKHVSYIFS